MIFLLNIDIYLCEAWPRTFCARLRGLLLIMFLRLQCWFLFVYCIISFIKHSCLLKKGDIVWRESRYQIGKINRYEQRLRLTDFFKNVSCNSTRFDTAFRCLFLIRVFFPRSKCNYYQTQKQPSQKEISSFANVKNPIRLCSFVFPRFVRFALRLICHRLTFASIVIAANAQRLSRRRQLLVTMRVVAMPGGEDDAVAASASEYRSTRRRRRQVRCCCSFVRSFVRSLSVDSILRLFALRFLARSLTNRCVVI